MQNNSLSQNNNQNYNPNINPNINPNATVAPATPKSPADTKKIIIIISAIFGGILLLVLAVIFIPMIFSVDYSTAYNTAKELKEKVSDIYYDYSCTHVVDYVSSSYYEVKSHEEDISDCENLFSGVDQLVARLGETDGVKKNSEINEKYETFRKGYETLYGSQDNLGEKLKLYSAWHKYTVAVSNLSKSSSSDADVTAAANNLINSGNQTLQTYGEGWLEKTLTLLHAYQAYMNTSYSASDYKSIYQAYKDADTEQSNYVTENKPAITDLVPIETTSASDMYKSFNTLYDAIRTAYQENYHTDSGDCYELFGEVVCD